MFLRMVFQVQICASMYSE